MEPVRVGPCLHLHRASSVVPMSLAISPHGSPKASFKRLRLPANSSGKTWAALL